MWSCVVLISAALLGVVSQAVILTDQVEDCDATSELSCLKNSDKAVTFCCSSLDGSKCCSEAEYFSQFPSLNSVKAEPHGLVKGAVKIALISVGVVVAALIICCVCCICCPFCLCHKTRRGRVLRRNDEQVAQQPLQAPIVLAQPQQPRPYPVQQPQAPITSGYPLNPPPYPGLQNTPQPVYSKEDMEGYARQPAYNPDVP